MKNTTANKLRLGVFISVGVLIFIVLIYYIGQKQWLFTPTIKVVAYFDDVTGLQLGNKVRFAGYNVGSVDDIAIVSDTSARVEMIIDKKATKFMKKDAVAIIGSEGLMGSKVINIGPGITSKATLADNDVLKTITPPSIDDIVAQMQVAVENASYITYDVAVITGQIRSGQGTLGKLLMDSSYAEVIGQTLGNIESSTEGMKELVPAVKNNFLLRGYYKKQKKAEEEKQEQLRKDKEKEIKKQEKETKKLQKEAENQKNEADKEKK